MTVLKRGSSTVQTVFGIHGDDENDLSGGFAYLLAHSEALLKRVVSDLLPRLSVDVATTEVRIQSSRKGEGITDIEVVLSDQAFIVFEAKKGVALPTIAQLRKYVPRCRAIRRRAQLVALTAARRERAELELGITEIDGVPLTARSWEWVRSLVAQATGQERGRHIRWLLSEYSSYLEGFMGHDRIFSNLVYVVSLGQGNPEGWSVSWIDVVEQHHRYFYPVGKNWPTPPNYIGFRYNGQLQSIHHVRSYQVVTDLRDHFPVTENAPDWGRLYLLELGPGIRPPHEVRTGSRVRRSARVWCMLDALLTSPTISDALSVTERRQNEEQL